MMRVRRTGSGQRAQIMLVAVLTAAAGLAGALAVGPVASASPLAGKAAAPRTLAWRVQAPPVPSGTTNQGFGGVSCSSSSACLAIAINDFPRGFGEFAETWNGSRWAVQRVPGGQAGADLDGVTCRTARWCLGVGSKASGDVTSVPVADRWNGTAWTQARPPVPAGATTAGLSAAACTGTRACTAVGSFARGTGAPRPLAERWNGSAWKTEPVPAPTATGSMLTAVACRTVRACRAVGTDLKGLFSEIWNGSTWRIRPVPVPAGGSFAELNDISCPAADSCEAVGSYSNSKGDFRSLAEAWNGSRWHVQARPPASVATVTRLNAVSCVSATNCEAAGDARITAGTQAGALEKWNGSSWSVQKKVLPAGDKSAGLSGISCTTGPVCEAVGYQANTSRNSHLLALRYST